MTPAPGAVDVALLLLGVFADTAVGLGLLLPAELALLLLGNAASDDVAHPVAFPLVAALAALAALLGSLVGLLVGRRWPAPPSALAVVPRLGPGRLAVLSRPLPFGRPLAGALLGSWGLSAPRFLRTTAVITAGWTVAVLLIGRSLGDALLVGPAVGRVAHLCLWLPLLLGLTLPLLDRAGRHH